MATKEPIGQEGIDTPGLRAVREQSQVGVDARGREHYMDSYRQCVWVVEDETVIWRQSLANCELADWVRHIESVRGWETLFWSPGTMYDRLAEVFGGG